MRDKPHRPRLVVKVEPAAAIRTAKTLMSWTGASDRTIKNWLVARSGPRAPI